MTQQSQLIQLLHKIAEHWATLVAIAITSFGSIMWAKYSGPIYLRLQNTLGEKGILAVLLLLLAALLFSIAALMHQRAKAKPLFERLIPVPGSGYCRDPKHNQLVCPRCASEDRKSYLAEMSDDALYCQSCGHGVKRFREKE